MLTGTVAVVVTLVAAMLILQAAFTIAQTLYIWNDGARVRRSLAPTALPAPRESFTILLPARHEQAVLGETLRRLGRLRYPAELVEILVLCTEDDDGTIRVARDAIAEHDIGTARVVVAPGAPGKARMLNLGLAESHHGLVTVFDSEDDVSEDLLTIANAIYGRGRVDVLQGGVQLMDFDSRWYASSNVLEYFFWFKSRMHYFARLGSVVLGGNTVFVRREHLREIGGWDERNLTEDADLGVRLSLAGRRFGVFYDPAHVTREEVPATVRAFVKQRTRWNQGFVQVLRKGDWLALEDPRKVLVLGYILASPLLAAMMTLAAPVLILAGLLVRLPVLVSLLTFVPLLLAVAMVAVNLLGLQEFARDHGLRVRARHFAALALATLPYQALLAFSALRAVQREFTGQRGWEKTEHSGQHRPSGLGQEPEAQERPEEVSVRPHRPVPAPIKRPVAGALPRSTG